MARLSPLDEKMFAALLSATPPGGVEELSQRLGLPLEELISWARAQEKRGLRILSGGKLLVEGDDWIKLLERAVRLGMPLEMAAKALSWRRFERLCAEALARHGFETKMNLRFSHGGRMWEADVLGVRGGYALCLDCKHWKRLGSGGGALTAARSHLRRVYALAESIPSNPPFRAFTGRRVYGVVVTLLEARHRLVDGCFVVPLFGLNRFLEEFDELRGLGRAFEVRRVRRLLERGGSPQARDAGPTARSHPASGGPRS